MASPSGVSVESSCLKQFHQNFKMRSSKGKYMVFRISDDLKQIVLHSQGDKDTTFEQFIEKEFPATECRYAVYKMDFTTEEGEREKLVLFSWVPSSCGVKAKFLHAASIDAIKKSTRCSNHFQCL
eukprot:TRINITY_DN5419_c0_g1_i1.p1 TRINITY_DN5419_c0_g1~~TRINITY_DN5419_c0_g1_i1.p1  ORF type:complete len:125 (-),score=21.52 TRINITY_DN5419_c0_g1_i1:156-530(-)